MVLYALSFLWLGNSKFIWRFCGHPNKINKKDELNKRNWK